MNNSRLEEEIITFEHIQNSVLKFDKRILLGRTFRHPCMGHYHSALASISFFVEVCSLFGNDPIVDVNNNYINNRNKPRTQNANQKNTEVKSSKEYLEWNNVT